MRATYFLLFFGSVVFGQRLNAQVQWNQTYPLELDAVESTTLFVEETDTHIRTTTCMEGDWVQLEIDAETGALSQTSTATTGSCQQIQLANGDRLVFEQEAEQYRFTQYNNGQVVWTKLLDIENELSIQQVVAHPTSGFYICESQPFRFSRYNGMGAIIYQQSGWIAEQQDVQIGAVVDNGDVFLHAGNASGRNYRVHIIRLAGIDGRIKWENRLETAERVNRDTRIAASLSYPTIAVTNHFIRAEGWETLFLDAETGDFLNDEVIFSYAERNVTPTIIPNKGIFLTESYAIDRQVVENRIQLHCYNESGSVVWRNPLLNSQLAQSRLVHHVKALPSKDLLITGLRNDSLWMTRLTPDGDLSEVTEDELNEYPDLSISIHANRPDLPLYGFLTFTLMIENKGRVAAEDIHINAPFIDYQTLTGTGNESVTKGEFYNWTGEWLIDRLGPREIATLTIQVFVLVDHPTSRYFSVYEQTPADLNETDNSVLLYLPYTGVWTDETTALRSIPPTHAITDARATGTGIHLDLDNTHAGETTVALLDVSGRLVQQQDIAFAKGKTRVSFGGDGLPRGLYIVQRMDTGESRKVWF